MEKILNKLIERIDGVARGTGSIFREINELTNAINKNSKRNSELTQVGHYLTYAIIFLGIVQGIIAILTYIKT